VLVNLNCVKNNFCNICICSDIFPVDGLQIVKPFLDPKTFQKVKFVYTRNTESRKLLDDYFENDVLKEVLENPADYNHEEYAKLMEQDDLKSATYWKLGEED
jgi:hypothetical protein